MQKAQALKFPHAFKKAKPGEQRVLICFQSMQQAKVDDLATAGVNELEVLLHPLGTWEILDLGEDSERLTITLRDVRLSQQFGVGNPAGDKKIKITAVTEDDGEKHVIAVASTDTIVRIVSDIGKRLKREDLNGMKEIDGGKLFPEDCAGDVLETGATYAISVARPAYVVGPKGTAVAESERIF
jgi:hypothetical protein